MVSISLNRHAWDRIDNTQVQRCCRANPFVCYVLIVQLHTSAGTLHLRPLVCLLQVRSISKPCLAMGLLLSTASEHDRRWMCAASIGQYPRRTSCWWLSGALLSEEPHSRDTSASNPLPWIKSCIHHPLDNTTACDTSTGELLSILRTRRTKGASAHCLQTSTSITTATRLAKPVRNLHTSLWGRLP